MRRSSGGGFTGRVPAILTSGVVLLLTAACSGEDGSQAPATPAAAATTAPRAAGQLPTLGDAWTPQDVQAMYEKDKGLKLSLPVTLPEGYKFVGFLPPDVRENKNGKEHVIARKAWFSLGHETVTVCAELVKAEGDICPESNIEVSSTRKGVLHTVSAEIPVSNDTLDWGENNDYSPDPADWTWFTPAT